jgi:hypothetical protein
VALLDDDEGAAAGRPAQRLEHGWFQQSGLAAALHPGYLHGPADLLLQLGADQVALEVVRLGADDCAGEHRPLLTRRVPQRPDELGGGRRGPVKRDDEPSMGPAGRPAANELC